MGLKLALLCCILLCCASVQLSSATWSGLAGNSFQSNELHCVLTYVKEYTPGSLQGQFQFFNVCIASFSGDSTKDGFNTLQSVVLAPPADSGLLVPSNEVSVVPAAAHATNAKAFLGVMWQFETARAESDSPLANVTNWSLQSVGVGSTLNTPVALWDSPVPSESLMFVTSDQPSLTARYLNKNPAWVWFPRDVFNYTVTAASVSKDGKMVCVTWPLRNNEAGIAGARSFVSCHESTTGAVLFRTSPAAAGDFTTAVSIDLLNNIYVGKSVGGVESFTSTGVFRFNIFSASQATVISPPLLHVGKSLAFIMTSNCEVRSFNTTSGELLASVADVSRWCISSTLSPSNRASSFMALRTPGSSSNDEGPLLIATADWLIALSLSVILQPPGSTEWPISWYVRTSYCEIPVAPFIVDQINVYYTACEKSGSGLSFYFESFPLPVGSNWPVLPPRHPISPVLQYGLGIGIPVLAVALLVASFLYCTRSQPLHPHDRRPLISSRV